MSHSKIIQVFFVLYFMLKKGKKKQIAVYINQQVKVIRTSLVVYVNHS